MKHTLISSVAAIALLGAGCTATFDEGLRDNIGRACVTWTGAYAVFQEAVSGGLVPAHIVAKVDAGNRGIANLCDHRAEITDIYTAGIQIVRATSIILQALRDADVPVEAVE